MHKGDLVDRLSFVCEYIIMRVRMNKVSYTIRLTVSPVPQVDAVVRGCSRDTFLFVEVLAGNQTRGNN